MVAVAVTWCGLCAALLIVARAVVLAALSDLPSPFDAPLGFFVALPASFLAAWLAAWPRIVWRGGLGVALHALCSSALVSTSLGLAYYEAVTGDVATGALLYYADELPHLWPSIRDGVSGWLPLTTIGLVGMLMLAWHGLSRLEALRDASPRAAVALGALIAAGGALLSLGGLPLSDLLERAALNATLNVLIDHAAPPAHTAPASAGDADALPALETLAMLQRMSGAPATAGQVEGHPYCAARAAVLSPTASRSAIVLILEGVGSSEFDLSMGDGPVMPRLRELAQHGLTFRNFLSSGSKSSQAIPALFAGLPPQPGGNVLWLLPARQLQGFPTRLAQAGYHLTYLHGGSLSFENQRIYLERLGFTHPIGADLGSDVPVVGWGYPDGLMLDLLRDELSAHRARRPEQPYFASLFTLTTHHPYALPAGHVPAFANVGGPAQLRDLAESLRYLDTELGRFYDWFVEHEAPRGTVLMLVGDHAGYLSRKVARERGDSFDSRTPLIVLGLSDAEQRTFAAYSARRGGHHDVPATLGTLLGVRPGPCDQGLSLLTDDDARFTSRVVYSVAHDDLSELNLWSDAGVFTYNHRTDTLRALSVPGATPQQPATGAQRRALTEFAQGTVQLSRYLVRNDALAPADPSADTAIAPVGPQPLRIVSHRGNTRGPADTANENTVQAIELAVAAGFEWVEVDLNLTADGQLVLHHDGAIDAPNGQRVPVIELSLAELRALSPGAPPATLPDVLARFDGKINFLLEAKPQDQQIASQNLARALVHAIAAAKLTSSYVIDTFDVMLATTIAETCACEVGFDLPGTRPIDSPLLTGLWQTGVRWLYLDAAQVSDTVIEQAHRHGIRVMAYTVNDLAQLAQLQTQRPDGILTDRAELRAAIQQRWR